MKFAILFGLLFLVACTTTNNSDPMGAEENLDHIGCQEGEIDEQGTCVVAEEKNIDLFSQDLSNVRTEEISGDIRGFLAEPSTAAEYPGLLIIHEWWGLNDNMKEMAKLLANEGYVVFAIDLYDGQVATESSTAGQLAGSVRNNPEKAIDHMKRAKDFLETKTDRKIGSLGWCFGGQQSLQASLNDDFDATVIYYGQLVDDTAQLMSLNGPVLGIFGSEDRSISVDSVNSFQKALNEVGVENEIHIYDGVGHAFANPSGSNYAAEETRDAWQKTVTFLNENLQ